MIGIIVTGHGNFATGLTSSIDLIAGPQENYVACDFDGTSEEMIANSLKAAFETLKDCSGIIVFSDLPGGTPFKTAVICSQGMDNVEVIAGTNLPMLCEIAMARTMIDDVHMLANSAVATGQEQVVKYAAVTAEENTDEDGI